MRKYQLVQNVEGQMIETIFDGMNLVDGLEFRGFVLTGFNRNPRQRAELQGEPKFSGLCGPMWGGHRDGVPMIRYEDKAAYDTLST